MPASAPSRSRDVVSTSVAEQFAPILELHDEIRTETRAVVEPRSAHARIAAGLAGFDPVKLLLRSRALAPAFDRAVDALEISGIVSTTLASAVRQGPFDAGAMAASWAAGDAVPAAGAHRAARKAAAIVAGAVLQRNAERIVRFAPIDRWVRKTCPCCGGFPDLASTVSERERILICSRCDTRWSLDGLGCVGCAATSEPAIARVRSLYLGYDLMICNVCGRYLKECRGPLRYHPMIERALTAQMDAAAELRGLRL